MSQPTNAMTNNQNLDSATELAREIDQQITEKDVTTRAILDRAIRIAYLQEHALNSEDNNVKEEA